jgi:hypothetical protein
MAFLQQLLLEEVHTGAGVHYVCELETMTALTKLHLSIQRAGFSGAVPYLNFLALCMSVSFDM